MKTKMIQATVKLSRAINYNTFSVEYTEQRELTDEESKNIESNRQLLLDDCTEAANNQLWDILQQNTDVIRK